MEILACELPTNLKETLRASITQDSIQMATLWPPRVLLGPSINQLLQSRHIVSSHFA